MRLQQGLALLLGLVIIGIVFLGGNLLGLGIASNTSRGFRSGSINPQERAPATNDTTSVPVGKIKAAPTVSRDEIITSPTPLNCLNETFQRRPLLGAPLMEVAQYTLHYTCHNYHVMGGSAAIRLARPVTLTELPTLGLGTLHLACDEPGLALVILQGDFDMQGMMPMGAGGPYSRQLRVSFIGYVINLRVGLPTLTMLSETGGKFKLALNDPGLPDELGAVEITSQPGTATIGVPTIPVASGSLPCGTPVPGVTPPSSPLPTVIRTRIPQVGTPVSYLFPTVSR